MRCLYLVPQKNNPVQDIVAVLQHNIVQEVGKKRIFPGYGCEENLVPPYAAQNELAATISCITFQTSKR
jgi:hypothetical protein